MHVRASVEVDRPLEECRAALLDEPQSWLPRASSALEVAERDFMARVGFSLLGLDISKRIRVHVGEPSVLRDWVRIPLEWQAQPAEGAFPIFTGELELTPVDSGLSKLVISGTYAPPFGELGRAADGLVMKTAAQATVKHLAEDIARQIRRGTGPGAAGSNGRSGAGDRPVESSHQMSNRSKEVSK